MQKTRPTIPKLAIMVVFALSCFGIVLYLWTSFGGPSPLAAKEYELRADFNEARSFRTPPTCGSRASQSAACCARSCTASAPG